MFLETTILNGLPIIAEVHFYDGEPEIECLYWRSRKPLPQSILDRLPADWPYPIFAEAFERANEERAAAAEYRAECRRDDLMMERFNG